MTLQSPVNVSNTAGLTKLGAGTLTLGGTNVAYAYSGPTFIDVGTLVLASTDSITNSTVVTQNAATFTNQGTVANPLPVVNASLIASGWGVSAVNSDNIWGENIGTLTATVSPANTPTTPFSVTVNWGDGSAPVTYNYSGSNDDNVKINHIFADPANGQSTHNFPVTMTVLTATNLTDTVTTTTTYYSVQPEIWAVGQDFTMIGSSQAVTLTAEVFGPDSPFTYAWSNWSPSPTIVYSYGDTVCAEITPGQSYYLFLRVTNDDGLSTETQVNITGTTVYVNTPIPTQVMPTLTLTETDQYGENPGDLVAGSAANFLVTINPPLGAPQNWMPPYNITMLYAASDGPSTAYSSAAYTDQDYTALDANGNPVRGPQVLTISSGLQAPFTISTFDNLADFSATTFKVTISNAFEGGAYGQIETFPISFSSSSASSAKATLLHGVLDPNSGNENYTGVPDHTSTEVGIENTVPGKFIAAAANPAPGAHFVPLDLRLDQFTNSSSPSSTHGISFTITGVSPGASPSNLVLWTKDYDNGGTQIPWKTNDNQTEWYSKNNIAGLSVTNGNWTRLFVQATAAGVYQISITVVEPLASNPSKTETFTDTVLFTALDENITCLECTYGFTVGPKGIAYFTQNEAGDTSSTGDIYMSSASPGGTTFDPPPYLVLCGNAVAILQDDEVLIWDRIDNKGLVPRDPDEQGTLAYSGGNYVETDLNDGMQWTFAPEQPCHSRRLRPVEQHRGCHRKCDALLLLSRHRPTRQRDFHDRTRREQPVRGTNDFCVELQRTGDRRERQLRLC